MGVAISGWPLARAVASTGQLGVVSGTAIDTVFIRRLQDNGIDSSLRAVLDRFPLGDVVQEVEQRFAKSLRPTNEPYLVTPMLTHRSPQKSIDLLVLAAYFEVALAKEGHEGPVGINLLTKIQVPTAPTLLGAMLAGVDYVMMGAGMPTHIPGMLDELALGNAVEVPFGLVGPNDGPAPILHFDPSRYLASATLRRPRFIGIVSSHVLATALAKRSNGKVDGFVVERPSAGGHNAPPRGQLVLASDGSPEYGERDRVDFESIAKLDLPFWIGGGVTCAKDVEEALDLGATGVQVGTLFAYCNESGMDPLLRERVIAAVRRGPIEVKTSMQASSTGYPFKVTSVEGTISQESVYEGRERKCDLGYLRDAYVTPSGSLGYRCTGEPETAFVRKGGSLEDTQGVTCLCNGLMATCGLGQIRSGHQEPPIVTSGDHINDIRNLLATGESFSASDVIKFLQPVSRT
jgi:NAD(P)H-dependent flavin oxidoreductase YrpB (nitropropane dioxygenase family)